MKFQEFYESCVKSAMKVDMRGKKILNKVLEKNKKSYKKLDKDEKEYFDKDSLWNPYYDTRILNGTGKEKISKVLVGIDIGVSEILLAQKLNENGAKIDAIVSHHPNGRAVMDLYRVMEKQVEELISYGVSESRSEAALREQIANYKRGLHVVNHNRVLDAAKLLDIPLICTHSVADVQVQSYLKKEMEAKKPETLGEVTKLLMKQPEYKNSKKVGAGPMVLVGSNNSRAGKIFVGMAGGLEGGETKLQRLADQGVSTLLEMHVSKQMKEMAEKQKVNIVLAGHISSDTLGMNLMFDSTFKGLKFVEASGFRRFKRK